MNKLPGLHNTFRGFTLKATEMASQMELYWGSGSVPSWIAMIALEEKRLQGYKSHLISFDKNEQKGDELSKLNPRCQVPTFRHGDAVINESQAICDYLEAAFPNQGHRLFPADPIDLGNVLQRKYETVNVMKKVLEDYIYPRFEKKAEEFDQELMKKQKVEIVSEMRMWDGYLQENSKNSFLAGMDFSMADVVFFPMLAFMVRAGFKLEPRFPHINTYYNKLKDRPSVQATWPPHWRDSKAGTILADC